MPSIIAQRSAGLASTSARVMAVPPRAGPQVARLLRANSTNPGAEKALFGEDFGARDPYAAEIESNFGEKVLGHYNTDHIIRPPEAMGKIIGLAARSCPPASELALLSESDRDRLRQQVPGWRIVEAGGAPAIQQEWAAKDGEAAQRLVDSIAALAAEQGHAPASVEAVSTTVIARLSTAALGGLTEADFIVAAKINSLDVAPLLAKRKQRFWA